MTDWRDIPKGELVFEMLPPANLNDSYGAMEGVILSGCSITEGYYTDARVSAKIEVEDGSWIRQSAVRIIYRVPEMNYEEELGTFFASKDGSSFSKGSTTVELNLISALATMGEHDVHLRHWLQPGSFARTAMRQFCDACHRELVDDGANDHQYTEQTVMPSSESYLKRMFTLCEDANDRLDVDGHGRVRVSAYVRPSERTPSFEIDLLDPRGIAHDSISRESDYLSMPSEVHVVYRWTEGSGEESQQMELSGSAYGTGHVSYGARGFIVSKVEVLNELDPATEWKAIEEARSRFDAVAGEDVEWTLTSTYLPIHAGDVGWLRGVSESGYEGDHLVMVKSKELSLDTMDMKLVLKTATSADWGE